MFCKAFSVATFPVNMFYEDFLILICSKLESITLKVALHK